MANLDFMQKKFSLESLVSHYLQEIKNLRGLVQSPNEEKKLQLYFQAASTFKNLSIKEIVQFITSYGRNASPQATQMRNAFPTLLGNRVTHPTAIDLAYARLLLEYTQGFAQYKGNLSNWLLRFVISSRFSPLQGLVAREIRQVIADTERKIVAYQAVL